jgi:hypothetical protein
LYFSCKARGQMTHSSLASEVFIEIAADTVKKYLAEIKTMSALSGKPSFDELLVKLKTLNAELTTKALTNIKHVRGQNINATQNLVNKYHQIISSSVNIFVKEL